MLDANALAYVPDTEIADVDDDPTPIAFPRVATRDLTVHVMIDDGTWHRRTPDLATTSCGIAIHSQFTPTRREELRHPLSRECHCFTPFELARADEIQKRDDPKDP